MEGQRIQIIIGGDTVFDAVCQDWTVLDKRDTLAAEVEVVEKRGRVAIEAKHPFDPTLEIDPEVPNGI